MLLIRLIFVLLAANVASIQTSIADEPLRVAINATGKPYSYTDLTGSPRGINRDVVESVFKRMNVDAEYKLLLYTRGALLVDKGKIDAMAVITTLDGPMSFPKSIVITPTPIAHFPLIVYKLASSNVNVKEEADLEKLRVGIVRADLKPDPDTTVNYYYPRYEFLFKALADGEIDVALALPYFEKQWERQFGIAIDALITVDQILVYMGFSTLSLGDQAQFLCREYSQVTQKSQTDGSFAKVLTAAGIPDLIPYFVFETESSGADCIPGTTLVQKNN